MPVSTQKQNQYFKFEKDNKNNVIKKTLNANQSRRFTNGVTTVTSRTKSLQERPLRNIVPPLQLSSNAAKRNVYQPPIRNVQRDYSVAAPRVQTRLTPLTTLSTAATKYMMKDFTRPARTGHSSRNTPTQSPTRPTIASLCKQRLPFQANNGKPASHRKHSPKKPLSPIEAANQLHLLLAKRDSSPAATSQNRSESPSKSRSPSSSPHRATRITFKSSDSTMESYAKQQNAETPQTPPPSPRAQIDSNVLAHSMEKILTKSNMKLNTAELQLLRSVVQGDERAVELRHSDTQLFKDILRSQLQQIVAQESIVTRALHRLDNTRNEQFAHVMRQLGIDEQLASDVEEFLPPVPLVEKEVQLLQTLSKRLEEKFTKQDAVAEMRSVTTSVTNLKPIMRRVLEYAVHKLLPQQLAHLPDVKGVQCLYGSAQEYHIVKRSLLELKQHASDTFYVPADAELKCTTFAELQQDPELLLRYLNPKHAEGMKFNILDQDPVFFQSYFIKRNEKLQLQQKCALKWHEEKQGFPVEELQLKLEMGSPRRSAAKDETPKLNRQTGGGDETAQVTNDQNKIEKVESEVEPICQTHDKQEKTKDQIGDIATPRTPRHFLSTLLSLASVEHRTNSVATLVKPKMSVAAGTRRRVRRKITAPVVFKKESQIDASSHQLLKTILVGSLQLGLFLLLIMLFTYPDTTSYPCH